MSAGILIKPCVMISPGRVLDVAMDMHASVVMAFLLFFVGSFGADDAVLDRCMAHQ